MNPHRVVLFIPLLTVLVFSALPFATSAAGATLSYAVCLGGSGLDSPGGAIRHGNGDFYITGFTTSPNFPPEQTGVPNPQAFLSRLDPSGVMRATTLFGGSFFENSWGIGVAPSGRIFVVGTTSSLDFPTTPNAYQQSYGGGTSDGFIAEFSSDGKTLQYATYVGGSGHDSVTGITFDGYGNIVVVGTTKSANLSTTTGVVQTSLAGGFDMFVAKFEGMTRDLIFMTYLGGSEDDGSPLMAEGGHVISPGYVRTGTDLVGNIYLIGDTGSADFPLSPGAYQTRYGGGVRDVVIAKLDPLGRLALYTTFIGGRGLDFAGGIVVGAEGQVIFSATSESTDLPTVNAHQKTLGGIRDGVVGMLDLASTRAGFITFLGGPGGDTARAIAVDFARDTIYVTGATKSSTGSSVVKPSYDFYFAEASTAGVFRRVTDYETPNDDAGLAIDVGPNKDVYVFGFTNSTQLPGGKGTCALAGLNLLAMRFDYFGSPSATLQTKRNNANGVLASLWLANDAPIPHNVRLSFMYYSVKTGLINIFGEGIPVALPANLPKTNVFADVDIPFALLPGGVLAARVTNADSTTILSEVVCETSNCASGL